MPDSLDDLLSSCSLASRAIRLLTAETKRRAILLRACCSEYELALDRLSLARLHALHQQDSQHQDTVAAVASREPLSAENPDVHREAGQSRSKSRYGAKVVGFDAASATGGGRASFRDPSAEGIAALRTATIENAISHECQVSVDSHTSEESSRITKSLEDILEQARSIRTSNSKEAGGAASFRKRATTATSSEQAAAVTVSGSGGGRGKTGGSRAGRGRSTSASSSGVKGGAPRGASNATPRAVVVPDRYSKKTKAVGSVASASQERPRRSRTGSLHSGNGQPRSVPGHTSGLTGTGAAGKAPLSTAAAHSHVRGSTSSSGPRGSETVQSRAGASRSRLSDSLSAATQSGRSEHPGKQKKAVAVPATAVTGSTEVAANLGSGMWEQVARYEAARGRLIGRNGISSRSCSGGDGADKDGRGGFDAAEEALLHGLDSDSFVPCNGGYAEGRDNARPDPQFLELRELLLSQLPSECEACPQQEIHSQDRLGAGSGADPRCQEGSAVGPEESRGRNEPVRLDEIDRLQRSLLMLLDEVEGKRGVLAHEELQLKRRINAERGGDGRPAEGDGGGNSRRSLHEFEDWYCWNKVAHVTGLLRECLDEMTHDSCSGGGSQSSLSKEAASLIEHPSLVLAGENPLHCLSQPRDDSHWRRTWQRSSGVQDLCGTACFALVQELQANTPSFWPHDRDSARGHTAELFAQELRTTSILAAETDVSRLVIPALARQLSHACLRKCPPDQASSVPVDQMDVQQHCQQTAKAVAQPQVVSGQGAHNADVECLLRERVSNRPRIAGKEAGCGDDEKREEALWAPALAVFRAVDAVLSGGGRPRMGFVHRSAVCDVDRM